MAHIPYIEGTGKQAALYVDGKPFYARSGEIHNSSASSLEYMDARVWPALRNMNMNCVVAPIYWECVEPQEGVFDFTLIDGLLSQARRENVRLVLLWFGLWKNAASTYAPEWVRTDHKRFWYATAQGNKPLIFLNGTNIRILSPLCAEAVAADAKAYAAVMKHLREVDEQRTVIMMQVENEIGIFGADRDYSPVANAAFAEQIPEKLTETFGVSGTWSEAFGKDAAETFMAWHYGCAVEKIIEAGKAEYDLPMYVNAWLEQAPWKPGLYPSGGPQFKMHKVWRAAAPSVALYAPDIYVDYYRDVVDEYASDGNPLFIPEVRQTADTVAFYLYAVGQHNAMCFAPFGVEDMCGIREEVAPEVLAALNISTDAMSGKAGYLLADVYGKVAGMEEMIEKAHREGKVHGFLSNNGERLGAVQLRNVNLHFSYNDNRTAAAGGLVLELGDYEFVVLACNCSMTFSPADTCPDYLDLLSKEEGIFENGVWKRGRIMNGDEQYMHSFAPQATMYKFKLCPYNFE